MRISVREHLVSFKRSWVHHTGMQLATFSVLAATFTVVTFVLAFSMNLKRMLVHWGESVQMTVYLEDTIEDEELTAIKNEVSGRKEFKSAAYVSKEEATKVFKKQMENYSPDLLEDGEFANPLPASFQLTVNEAMVGGSLALNLESIASQIRKLAGVEDVSFGQSWVRNYAAFVGVVSASGWAVIGILICGSLFVIGNSIRASIASRRDEIEIMELVGATSSMVRMPFVVEGALMGLGAAAIGVGLNLGIYAWEVRVLESTLELSRLVTNFSFFGMLGILGLIIGGGITGAFGAWATVRNINDGWSASKSLQE